MKKIITLSVLLVLIAVVMPNCKKKKTEVTVSAGTCSDGIKNQDETNVDCGGVCSVCLTCSDGIQNQNETGIDCGGPCGKCPITYPKNGFYGRNVIYNADTLRLTGSPFPNTSSVAYYSIAAKMPPGTTLRVKLTSLESNKAEWFYDVSSVGTWKVKPVVTNISEYYNTDQGSPDLKIMFTNNGSAKVEIFENDAEEPRWVKTIYWAL